MSHMKTLEQFIAEQTSQGLKFECHPVNNRPDNLMSDSAFHYRCKFTRKGKRVQRNRDGQDILSLPNCTMSLYFSQGSAHTKAPTMADVLNCLALDASGYENAKSFEDWASEYGYGYDADSCGETFRAVKRQSEQLQRVLGKDAYDELLWETESL